MPGMRIGPASAYRPSLKGVRIVCTRPPGNARASSTTTRWPASRRTPAARSPASPAPTTTTGRSTGRCLEGRRRPSDHRRAEGRQLEELSATDRAGRGDGFVRASHFVGLKSISVEGGAVGIIGRQVRLLRGNVATMARFERRLVGGHELGLVLVFDRKLDGREGADVHRVEDALDVDGSTVRALPDRANEHRPPDRLPGLVEEVLRERPVLLLDREPQVGPVVRRHPTSCATAWGRSTSGVRRRRRPSRPGRAPALQAERPHGSARSSTAMPPMTAPRTSAAMTAGALTLRASSGGGWAGSCGSTIAAVSLLR